MLLDIPKIDGAAFFYRPVQHPIVWATAETRANVIKVPLEVGLGIAPPQRFLTKSEQADLISALLMTGKQKQRIRRG